jgi:hypothetical protein
MPRIYYSASDYSGNYLHLNTGAQQFINCRKIDLYRAIITVGNPSYFTLSSIRDFGLIRALSNAILKKVILVQNYIDSGPNGMRLHEIYNQQVSDEKRIVSYNLGMAFAKIYSEKLLNIPNLIHVESLKKNNAITFHNTGGRNQEPDLVGQSIDGNWHVFEAKGMSRNNLTTIIREAKSQAEEIDTIHGQNPVTMSACATYLGLERIITRIADPESKGKKQLEIKRGQMLEAYYNSFLAFEKLFDIKAARVVINEQVYYETRLIANHLRLNIGLEEEIYDLLNQKNFELLPESISKNAMIRRERAFEIEQNYSLGLDGIIVRYTNHN